MLKGGLKSLLSPSTTNNNYSFLALIEGTVATTRGSAPRVAYRDNYSSSLHLIENVISCAGVVLDLLMREQLELKQEYRETIAAKTQKFASIWRHR